MGKSPPFWQQRLCNRRKGPLVLVHPPQRAVDPSFLLDSPISSVDSSPPSASLFYLNVIGGLNSLSDSLDCNTPGEWWGKTLAPLRIVPLLHVA